LTYLVEKQSEHPIAKTIVAKLEQLIPSKLEELDRNYKCPSFENKEGEGIKGNLRFLIYFRYRRRSGRSKDASALRKYEALEISPSFPLSKAALMKLF